MAPPGFIGHMYVYTCIYLYYFMHSYADRPKQGWMYGMLMDGKIGYFLEDHVTAIIDPIGSIKEKLQAGKAKVTDLPISKPTQFSHELHWGKNGEKWGKTEEELIRYVVTGLPLDTTFFNVVYVHVCKFVCLLGLLLGSPVDRATA